MCYCTKNVLNPSFPVLLLKMDSVYDIESRIASLNNKLRIESVKWGKCIHLIPKWRPINYSFVCMIISPLRLVNMCKKQKNFVVKMRRIGLINMQTKE